MRHASQRVKNAIIPKLTGMEKNNEHSPTLNRADIELIRNVVAQCISSDAIAASIAEKLGLDSPESEAIDSATARRLLGGISARTFYLYVRNYPELRMGCSRRYSRTRVMELKRLRQCGRMRFDRHKLKKENE